MLWFFNYICNISDKLNTPEKPWETKHSVLPFPHHKAPSSASKGCQVERKWGDVSAKARWPTWGCSIIIKGRLQDDTFPEKWTNGYLDIPEKGPCFSRKFRNHLNQSINFLGICEYLHFWYLNVPDLYDDYRKILRNEWPGCERGARLGDLSWCYFV